MFDITIFYKASLVVNCSDSLHKSLLIYMCFSCIELATSADAAIIIEKPIMKKYLISFAVAATFISSSSFAALNSYLQIKGSKGSTQIVSCPNGACVVPTLVADTYTVSVVDAQGKSVVVSSPMTCDVKSPRDSASGLATGKRQHKPFSLSTELSSSSVVIAQDESNLAITCSSGTPPASPATATTLDKPAKATYDLKSATK